MSHVRKLIAEYPTTWQDVLREKYKIDIVTDGEFASLKYNQLESPMGEPIVQECRGMVVHVHEDPAATQIVAWPYNKFWNYGESRADAIAWSTARVMDKADGSLMTVFWWRDEWRVASSGHPTAGGTFGKGNTETFGRAFWRTWKMLGMKEPPVQYVGASFMFEFCDQPNRIVVKHTRPRIVLHGARYLSGQELCMDHLARVAAECNWELIQSYPLASIEECLAAAEKLNPVENEGYVVVDQNFHRVKIKSPRYVALHHMKGEATERRAIQLWQSGETSEVLTHFPEFADVILPVQEKLDRIAKWGSEIIKAVGHLPRKDFAMMVKDLSGSSLLFKLYGNYDDQGVRRTEVDDAKKIMRAMSLGALETMVSTPFLGALETMVSTPFQVNLTPTIP